MMCMAAKGHAQSDLVSTWTWKDGEAANYWDGQGDRVVLMSERHANPPSSSIVVLKYSPDGTLLWRQDFGGQDTQASGAVIGADDSVLVGGSYVEQGITGLVLVKYDSGGARLWV